MQTLVDLTLLKEQLSQQVATAAVGDCTLPSEFESKFRKFGQYEISQYFRYTSRIKSAKSTIVIPNQWFYIAAICSRYHRELVNYREKLDSLGLSDDDYEACHPSGDNRKIPDNQKTLAFCEQKANSLLERYQGEDKAYLVRFLWDYNSWGGGKNIKRSNDFTESPVLNIANSINASSGLIGSIAKEFGNNDEIVQILMNSSEWENAFKESYRIEPQKFIKDNVLMSYMNGFISAIMTKPFLLLAGISGTGKSQIVRKLAQATDDIDTFKNDVARWELHKPANFELVQVKPNWHNSYDLVGYKSNINGEHYEYTPFIEFVAKAWQNPDTPFFLCLDEMNLAPVEEYFAEYLSAIESRSIDASTGQYETDPIIKPFKNYGKKVSEEMILHLTGEEYDSNDLLSELSLSPVANRFLNIGLTLPPNLIVMGTVNMDDTTFSFSRKVLDRAMSIEMNEVDFEGCIKEKENLQMPILTSFNSALVSRAIKSLEVIEGSAKQNNNLAVHLTQDEAKTITDYLSVINYEILDGTPFKLGYRACNEALLYARACKELGRGDFMSTAIDEFTTMKILSRIEGDEQKLKTKTGDSLLVKLQELISKKITLPDSKSLNKIKLMSNILERDKFVSFWG